MYLYLNRKPLQKLPTKIHLNTTVHAITKENNQFTLHYTNKDQISSKDTFAFLINAAGFQTGKIDDMLGYKRKRFVEFKAAYVTKWENPHEKWPEIIFHGKRGTPQGMGQFTPYYQNHFQLHGMTKNITLFENGLVKSDTKSSQPRLEEKFLTKIERKWDEKIVEERTQKAIKHIANFLPAFANASVVPKPLFGAQQIPGDDEDLRAADVSFEGDNYARCEVVKASSVLTMIDEIMKRLITLKFIDPKFLYHRNFLYEDIPSENILKEAQSICESREYPIALANLVTSKELNQL
jgi:hypothetical protein